MDRTHGTRHGGNGTAASRRLASYALACALVLLLPACGGGGSSPSDGGAVGTTPSAGSPPVAPQPPAPTTPPAPPPAEEPTGEPTQQPDDGVAYEPIPADPDIFYDGPPEGDAWERHREAWGDTYDAWDPNDSDWAHTQSDWQDAEISEQPEPDLNCDVCDFPRSGLRVIMQNDGHGDDRRTAQLRALSKSFLRRAVLESRGQIHDWWRDGTLAGVEFDWFFPAVGAPKPDEMLPTVGQVYGVDDDGLPVHLANVYCYNAAQFAARVKAVEAMIGHTMDWYTVWGDNTVTSTDADRDGARVQSGQSVVAGAVSSIADVRVTGNHTMDTVAYGKDIALQGNVQVGEIAKVTSVTSPVPTVDVEFARLLAQLVGHYYPGDVAFDDENPPPAGLVFAEGDILVETTGMQGTWTFVSAAGTVTLRGQRLDARGFFSDILVLAFTGDALIRSHQSVLRGEFAAPLGTIELHATDTTLEGVLYACEVKTSGGSMLLTDGTDRFAASR